MIWPGRGKPPVNTLRAGGFALLELVIAAALAGLLAVWAADRLMREVNEAAERRSGVWLREVRTALVAMLDTNAAALIRGDPVIVNEGGKAYANAFAPTLEELKAQGHLPAGFPAASVTGITVRFHVMRHGACPGPGCRLDALAYTAQPILLPRWRGTPEPDTDRIAGLLMASGGHVGSVRADGPQRLQGASFDFANPLAGGGPLLPVGTLALWAGFDPGPERPYLRLGDTRDPRFGGDVTVGGDLSVRGRVTAAGHLLIGGRASSGAACAPDGLLARDEHGGLLNCVAGRWSAPGGFGGAYSYNRSFTCHDYTLASTANPRTGKCSCPTGYRTVRVSSGGTWDEIPGWTEGYVCVR